MVVPSGKVPGMAVWRERLFAAMHLNVNVPAAYFGVPTGQVVEVGLDYLRGRDGERINAVLAAAGYNVTTMPPAAGHDLEVAESFVFFAHVKCCITSVAISSWVSMSLR